MHRQPPPSPPAKTTGEYSSETAGPNVRATALVLETDEHSTRPKTNRSIHFSEITGCTHTTVGIWFCTHAILLASELRPAGSLSGAESSEHITFGFMTNLSIHFSDTTAVTDPALCSSSGLSQLSLSAGGFPPAISVDVTDITVCSQSGLSQMSIWAGGLPPAISVDVTDISVCSLSRLQLFLISAGGLPPAISVVIVDISVCCISGSSQMSISAGGLPPAISVDVTDHSVCSVSGLMLILISAGGLPSGVPILSDSRHPLPRGRESVYLQRPRSRPEKPLPT